VKICVIFRFCLVLHRFCKQIKTGNILEFKKSKNNEKTFANCSQKAPKTVFLFSFSIEARLLSSAKNRAESPSTELSSHDFEENKGRDLED
jgi:hypothetical protein